MIETFSPEAFAAADVRSAHDLVELSFTRSNDKRTFFDEAGDFLRNLAEAVKGMHKLTAIAADYGRRQKEYVDASEDLARFINEKNPETVVEGTDASRLLAQAREIERTVAAVPYLSIDQTDINLADASKLVSLSQAAVVGDVQSIRAVDELQEVLARLAGEVDKLRTRKVEPPDAVSAFANRPNLDTLQTYSNAYSA